MMTKLLKKILDSENLLKTEHEKNWFSKIKKDLAFLLAYTSAFVEYKFLLELKIDLIPPNEVTGKDIRPFDKWKLIKLYEIVKDTYSRKSDFLMLSSDDFFAEYKEKFNEEDYNMLENSFLRMKEFLKQQKKDYTRFSVIFPKNRMPKIEKSIFQYFLYERGKLKLFDEESFLEDYFDEKNFIEPLNKFFSTMDKANQSQIFRIWLQYFAYPRVYLFSNGIRINKVTGYSEEPIFTGRIDYGYSDLKKRIGKLQSELGKELSSIFESDWLKSQILDILCFENKIENDISLELKERLLKKSLQNKK